MKLTDLALIFVAIFLPIVVITYVNTTFVVKSEKQEMYYKNLMNSAIADAVSTMKHIENEDDEIDYGYSGNNDKKVSVNVNTAISTFYNSLANNFNIVNNKLSLDRLKMYIPVIAVLDYDGVYIHSAEREPSGDISFVTKPKVYYTYSYIICKVDDKYDIVEANRLNEIPKSSLASNHIYEINFTMDDYVLLNIYEIADNNKLEEIVFSQWFYLKDNVNNTNLVYEKIDRMTSTERKNLKDDIEERLGNMRLEIIGEIGMREISYAVNKHNDYAGDLGVNYTFRFSVESDQVWYETIDGIGMIAIIQGISLGNRYLNYKAYSAADLIQTRKYFVSKGVKLPEEEKTENDLAYLARDLYHLSNKCNAYLEYVNSTTDKIVPNYYSSKIEAATQGYYPCPICKP